MVARQGRNMQHGGNRIRFHNKLQFPLKVLFIYLFFFLSLFVTPRSLLEIPSAVSWRVAIPQSVLKGSDNGRPTLYLRLHGSAVCLRLVFRKKWTKTRELDFFPFHFRSHDILCQLTASCPTNDKGSSQPNQLSSTLSLEEWNRYSF